LICFLFVTRFRWYEYFRFIYCFENNEAAEHVTSRQGDRACDRCCIKLHWFLCIHRTLRNWNNKILFLQNVAIKLFDPQNKPCIGLTPNPRN